MRRSALFLGPSLLAALAFACEDDPSGGQGVQFPEAGAPDTNRPAFDGSVPDGADGNARSEVEVFPSLVIPDAASLSPFQGDGETAIGRDDVTIK